MNVHLINIPLSIWPVSQKVVDALEWAKGGLSVVAKYVSECSFGKFLFRPYDAAPFIQNNFSFLFIKKQLSVSRQTSKKVSESHCLFVD